MSLVKTGAVQYVAGAFTSLVFRCWIPARAKSCSLTMVVRRWLLLLRYHTCSRDWKLQARCKTSHELSSSFHHRLTPSGSMSGRNHHGFGTSPNFGEMR